MATRREVFQRRSQLKQTLRERHENGELKSGEPVPPVRQLAHEFGLSNTVVTAVVSELVEEHLFHTVPRAGTFVGAPRRAELESYLLVLGEASGPTFENQHRQIQTGFEERIAHLGGAALTMDEDVAFARFGRSEMPALAGVLDITAAWTGGTSYGTSDEKRRALPRVRYAQGKDEEVQRVLGVDTIAFDDVRGGSDATRHLIANGHRRVGFFGLHDPAHLSPWSGWSAKREDGWRAAMLEAGLPMQSLAFHPAGGIAGLEATARTLGARLFQREAPTAVVAANDAVARGLLDTLDVMKVSPDLWPSVVGFDDDRIGREQLVSSLQLPWSEFGRVAANLLWERRRGRLPAEPQHRLLPMRLVPRLTCRPDWAGRRGEFLPLAA